MIARNDQSMLSEVAGAPKKESRRMALLKRMGLFGTQGSGVAVTRATSWRELQGAYKLVHDVFVEAGYINPRPCGLRLRSFESLAETATFVAQAEGQVVGVQSLVVDSPDLGLPSDKAFKKELDVLRQQGKVIGEATNEAVATAYRKSSVPTELMRCLFAHAMFSGCTELITTISPGHTRFYNLLGFAEISPIRSYSDEVEDPVVVVSISLEDLGKRFADVEADDGTDEGFLKSYYIEGNPYHQHVRSISSVAEAVFHDPSSLRALFVDHGDLLSQCTPDELDAIRRRWGSELVALVWPPRPWQKFVDGVRAGFERHMPSVARVARSIKAASF